MKSIIITFLRTDLRLLDFSHLNRFRNTFLFITFTKKSVGSVKWPSACTCFETSDEPYCITVARKLTIQITKIKFICSSDT